MEYLLTALIGSLLVYHATLSLLEPGETPEAKARRLTIPKHSIHAWLDQSNSTQNKD
jgi:hypothetical protein